MRMTTVLAVLLAALFLLSTNAGEQSLISPEKPLDGWAFGNGPEFPGAKGTLTVDDEVTHGDRPSLKLSGDFTGGGGYVQAKHDLPKEEPSRISLYLRFPGTNRLTFRVSDQKGTCHQIVLRIEETDQWQHIDFPLAEYFRRMGTPDAVTGVLAYETWRVADDRGWSGNSRQLCLLLSRRNCDPEEKKCSLFLSDV